MASIDLIATVLPGGHVTYELYEAVNDADKRTVKGPLGAQEGALFDVCHGSPKGSPPDPRRLIALVRGIVREAPNDRPNGYTEAAYELLTAARTERGLARSIGLIGESMADDCRAMQLALEEYDAAKGGA